MEMDVVRPELVIALVGAVGTALEDLDEAVRAELTSYGYGTEIVRLSELLHDVEYPAELVLRDSPEDARLEDHMTAGTWLREKAGRGDVVAGLAAMEIRARRQERTGDQQLPAPQVAYVLRSLKRPEEVTALRRVYGDHFVCVGAWADRESRLEHLAERLARSAGDMKSDAHRATAEALIARDEKELGHDRGQNVRDAFPESDFFVDASRGTSSAESSVTRVLRLMFAHPFITPSREESGMFHASAAAFRSAALGRQVGAAIMSDDGDVLAIGMNEVPRAHGGHYWENDPDDARDFKRGTDANDEQKRAIVRQVVEALREAEWVTKAGTGAELAEEALAKGGPLRDTWLMNLTEFGRDVHAEMSALMSAARRGVSVRGARLLCTTFPCHNCAKHIVAAGIREALFIEPYAKSFASELHSDSITRARPGDRSEKVAFSPFVGVAPRRYASWFAMRERKDSRGKTPRWAPHLARPWFETTDSGYITREREFIDSILASLDKAKVLLG